MARFRYSMQSLLDIKLKLETQAKQEFATAKNDLDAELDKLEKLNDRKREYQDKGKRLLVGTLDFREIEANTEAILRMDEYITAQQANIKKAERRLEDAREKLKNVMIDRKTHETLKEKAFEEFLREENRLESKSVDELTSYTYGQKKQVKN